MALPVQLEAFTLTFPDELDPRDASRWFESISGIRTGGLGRLRHVDAVVLELEATPSGFDYRLRAEPQHAAFLANQLRTLIPGTRADPAHVPDNRLWTLVVELGMRGSDRTLQTTDPERFNHSLLAALRGHNATVLVQWVLSPARRQLPPRQEQIKLPRRLGPISLPTVDLTHTDPVGDAARRMKLREATFLCVARIGIHSESPQTAQHVLSNIRPVFGSTHTASSGFYARTARQSSLGRSLNEARTPFLFPGQLSLVEAVSMCGWPIGSPHVAGLPQASSRQLPATAAIRSRGLVVAQSNFPGDERPLALSPEDLCKHLHIVGPTGTGKTVLCSNLAAQMMSYDSGFVMIESKGDLFKSILERVPKKRLDDIIVMDVSDSDFPVGFNVLSEGSSRVVVEELCALFEYLYRDTRGVWTRELLYYGLSTLTTRPDLTFVDLAPLLAPMRPTEEAWRNELVDNLTDPELKDFWTRFRAQPRPAQDRMAQPLLDRVWQLSARPEIRNIIGQSQSTFHMSDVASKNKILLVNLSGLGQATASLVGTLLVSALWRAVQATTRDQPTYLLLDEFQDFVQLPLEPADMLAKARSRKLGIVAAHQDLGQLPIELRQVILANARSKVVFQTTADDARIFTREFGRSVTDADFLNLGQYEVLCRLVTDSGVSAPVSGITLPPARTRPWSSEVRTLSRERYSRGASVVEAEIASRRSPKNQSNSRRPQLGGQEWG